MAFTSTDGKLAGVALALMIAVSGLAGWGVAKVERKLDRIAETVERIDASKEAAAVATLFLNERLHVGRERFCLDSADSPICQAVTLRKIDYGGSHGGLWILADLGVQVSRARLEPVERSRIDGIHFDLGAGLAAHGVLAMAMEDGGFPDRLTANRLYRAVLAHAAICASSARTPDCGEGLPHAVAEPLARMAAFVLEVGPRVAPYETKRRTEAVNAVLASGLLGEAGVPHDVLPVEGEVALADGVD